MSRKSKKQRHNWVVCPWCRKTDSLEIRGWDETDGYWVHCSHCDVIGPDTSATPAWAVRKWNKWADKPY